MRPGSDPVRLERLFAANDREIPELATLLKGEDLPKPAEWIVTGGQCKTYGRKEKRFRWMFLLPPKRWRRGCGPQRRRDRSEAGLPGVCGNHLRGGNARSCRGCSETRAIQQWRAFTPPNGAPAPLQVQYELSAPPAVAAAPAPVQAAVGGGQVTEVVTAFQSTMQQFLDYQMESNRQRQELMSRFLDTQRAMVEVFARGGSAPGPMVAMPEPQYVLTRLPRCPQWLRRRPLLPAAIVTASRPAAAGSRYSSRRGRSR